MLSRKVKLKLNKLHIKQLTDLSTNSKNLYNRLLQENFDRLDHGERTLTSFDMNKLCADRSLAPGIGTDVVQEVTKRVDRVLRCWQESQFLRFRMWLQHGENYKTPMKAYLTKAGKKLWGRPRFKVKPISIQFPLRKRKADQARVRVFGHQTSVKIPLIGAVRGRNDRQALLGFVKHVTIGRDSCGTWWATLTCDGEKPATRIVSRNEGIGVDLGLKHTITAANESEVIQPERERFLEKQMEIIRRASRERRRDLPFIHRKIVRRRKHSHHVQAKRLLEAADTIVVGNLNSKFLFSGKLARSASDAAHSQFLSILSYKASNAGKTVKIVNEAYTSQTCYNCGNKQKMELSEREYRCHCGYSNNRDVNAALNILRLGERRRPEAPAPKLPT